MYEDACASRKLRCDGHRRRVDTAYFHAFTTRTRGSITTTFALQAGLLQHSAKPPFPLPDAIVKHQPGTRAAGHLDSRGLKHKTTDVRGYPKVMERTWVLHCILLDPRRAQGSSISDRRFNSKNSVISVGVI